jgi:hypothetical protein
MPKVQLTIDIEIQNYREIVAAKKGSIFGFVTKIPLLGPAIINRVDSMVAEELTASLIKQLEPTIRDKLGEEGISAKVRVTPS